MAIFYMRTRVIGRSAKGGGRSAVECAAYQDRQKFKDLETGKTYDKTSKGGLVYSEVSLPDHWKPEFKDPEVLWNAVERKESRSDARFARQFVFAIPKEMDHQTQIDFCKAYVKEQFVSRGMAVDWAVHDAGDGNPHLHAMAVLRTCKQDGSWAAKEKKTYRIDSDGNRIPVLDEDGKQKVDAHGRKQWQRITVSVNDWEKLSSHSIEHWREAWAKSCNDWLTPRGYDPIDHRSYFRQEFEKWQTQRVEIGQDPGTKEEFKTEVDTGNVYVPKGMIHEGYWARKVEADGGESQVCDHNREIRVERSLMDWFKDKVESLEYGIEKIGQSIEKIVAKIKTARIEALSSIFGKEDVTDVFGRVEKETRGTAGFGNDFSADERDSFGDAVTGAEIYLNRAETAREMQRDSGFEQDIEAGSKRQRATEAGNVIQTEADPVDRGLDEEDAVAGRIDAGL